MATRSPLLRIHDMLESIRGIEKALAGKTMRDYERSWLLRSAVERGIEVISEASRHLGRDLKAQHKDVRWKDIAGIGNICQRAGTRQKNTRAVPINRKRPAYHKLNSAAGVQWQAASPRVQ